MAISLTILDEKIKYVKNNRLWHTRSDVPEEDTDLLVVPDEDSPFGSIAESAKRRTDPDRGTSNVLSESNSNIGSQFRTYNGGSTSFDQRTNIQDEPTNERRVDGGLTENKLVEEVSVSEKPGNQKTSEENHVEENVKEGKPLEEKSAEDKAVSTDVNSMTTGNVGYGSTFEKLEDRSSSSSGPAAGSNYAADASELLSAILKNETKNVHVPGEQKNYEGSTQANDLAQPTGLSVNQPSAQADAPLAEDLANQAIVQPPSIPPTDPQVSASKENPLHFLFDEEDASQLGGHVGNPTIKQPMPNAEQMEATPTQPTASPKPTPVTQTVPSTSAQSPNDQSPSVTGTAAGQGTIGSGSQTTIGAVPETEPPAQDSNLSQGNIVDPSETQKENQQSQMPPQPTSPPSEAPVGIDDLFGKHIVESADEERDGVNSSHKNTTIMLVQTGNQTQFISPAYSRSDKSSSFHNHPDSLDAYMDRDSEETSRSSALVAPPSIFFADSSKSYGGLQYSEQPASARHLALAKSHQDAYDYSKNARGQSGALSEGSYVSSNYASPNYAYNETLYPKSSQLQVQSLDTNNQSSTDNSSGNREETATMSPLTDAVPPSSTPEVTRDEAKVLQTSQTSQSNDTSWVESEATTTEIPAAVSYITDYSKLSHTESSQALQPDIKGDNSTEVNIQVNETNQENRYNTSEVGISESDAAQEPNYTVYSLASSSFSNSSNYSDSATLHNRQGEYNIFGNETREQNATASIKEIQEVASTPVPLSSNISTELSGNVTGANYEYATGQWNGSGNGTSTYDGYSDTGLSNKSWLYANSSLGNSSDSLSIASFAKDSSSLSEGYGINSTSVAPVQQQFNSSYINYSSIQENGNIDSLHSNYSQPGKLTRPSSAQSGFYDFSTITKEQMEVIQNAAVSKLSPNSSQASLQPVSKISPSTANKTENETVLSAVTPSIKYNEYYTDKLYNSSRTSNTSESSYSPSYSQNNGISSSLTNNSKPQFYDYDKITLEQMNAIQNAALSSHTYPESIASNNETLPISIANTTVLPFNYNKKNQSSTVERLPVASETGISSKDNNVREPSQALPSTYVENLAEYPRKNSSISNTSLPYLQLSSNSQSMHNLSSNYAESLVVDASSSKSGNFSSIAPPIQQEYNVSESSYLSSGYLYNVTESDRNKNAGFGYLSSPYAVVSNSSQPSKLTNAYSSEYNMTKSAAFENGTVSTTPMPSLTGNNSQLISDNVSFSGQYTSKPVPQTDSGSSVFIPPSDNLQYNYSRQSNYAGTKQIYSNRNISETSKVVLADYNQPLNSTGSQYAGQTIWNSFNTGHAVVGNMSYSNNSDAESNSQNNITSYPNKNIENRVEDSTSVPSSAGGQILSVTKAKYDDTVQNLDKSLLGSNKTSSMQALNSTQLNVYQRLVVGHFKQKDIELAFDQLSISKPATVSQNSTSVSQASLSSKNALLGIGSSVAYDNSHQYLPSIAAQSRPVFTQSNATSPSNPIVSASSSYSNKQLLTGKDRNYSNDTAVVEKTYSSENTSLGSATKPAAGKTTTKEGEATNQDKLPFKNEEPIVTSKLVNPADSSKNSASGKKPSLVAIISGGKKKPKEQCKYTSYKFLGYHIIRGIYLI